MISSTVVACPDPRSESCEDDELVHVAEAIEEGVLSKGLGIIGPVSPIFLSCFGSRIHDAIVNGSPRRHDVTRENNLSGNW